MKYVMMDTNIYLDMLVDRRKSISNNTVSAFKQLLDYNEIKLVVPQIVVYEVHKHIEEQLLEVGNIIKKAISAVNDIYDVCGMSETEESLNANENKKLATKQLKALKEKFKLNKALYLSKLNELIDEIFSHDNCIIIDDDDNIRSLCLKRKIYKKAPFHIDNKESFADGTITTTLINLKRFIDISDSDTIIFVTGNKTDFSDSKNKDILHADILDDLTKEELDKKVTYITNFGVLVRVELKDEVNRASLKEEFEKDLEEEEYQQICDYNDSCRESVGLSSLSGFEDFFIDNFAESSFSKKILSIFVRLNKCYSSLEDLFVFYDEELINYICNYELDDIHNFIEKWNLSVQNTDLPDAELSVGGLVDIIESIKEKSYAFDYSELPTDLPDYIEYGKSESFAALNKTRYTIQMDDLYLSCEDGNVDWLDLILLEGNDKIAKGNIEISYGHVTFNSEGNVDDASEQGIYYDFNDIELALEEITKEFEEWIKQENQIMDTISYELGI